MNVALTQAWTTERFLDWAGTQEERYEFDGTRPVLLTGGSARHSQIFQNILFGLRLRLRGTASFVFGPDLGIETIGGAVRYPDALVTCTRFPGSERLAPDPLVAFEVASPTSGRRDRIEKTREYAAVSSIRHYIIVESDTIGLLAMHRINGQDDWTPTALTGGDTLTIPELNIAIPVAEFYEDVVYEDDQASR